ncbi:hypothetical protein HDU93_005314 [Gonapodya sp. JEL0774]|nr:hypothetical protein HDU93_005314 [Gonapodya sp. JEL0774]
MTENGTVLLDSLPYIDKEYEDENIRAQVDSLIEAELQMRDDTGNEGRLPPNIVLFANNPLLLGEMERLEKGQKLNAIDTNRYRLPPPQEDDLESWKKAVDNARAQLEHQYSRELLAMTCCAMIIFHLSNVLLKWRIHNYQLEATNTALQKQLEEYSRKIVELNKLRKLDQTRDGQTLRQLSVKWSELVATHIQLETAYLSLDLEVRLLEQQQEAVAAAPSS